MEFIQSQENNVRYYELKGRFTFNDHDKFSSIITAIANKEAYNVVLVLGELEFVDSAALGLLLIARDEAAKHGVRLSLRNPRGSVLQLFNLAGFQTLFETTGGETTPSPGRPTHLNDGLFISSLPVAEKDGILRLNLSGRFTFADQGKFNWAIAEVCGDKVKSCLISLEGLDFIDSAAIGLLLILRDEAAQRKIPVTLFRPKGIVKKVLELSQMDELFNIEN